MKAIYSKLSRLAWTVRYLKARQIRGQLRHRVLRSFGRDGHANGQAATDCPGCAWPQGVSFLPPGVQENRADGIRSGILRFVNREQSLGFPPQWDCPALPKLWQYNLHYFEWLWALEYEDAKSVALDWMGHHPPAKGAVGWEPYPTSLRLMNWCAIFWGRFREPLEGDGDFLRKLWPSVVRQAEWLARHLEIHLLGNHYFENGAALAFVGSCFEGERANAWFEKGCRILAEQIPEQVLTDGMHFELSPMYQCRVIYVLAMLAATGNRKLTELVIEPLVRMLKALDVICHPDGRIALLNDSAFGIYNEPDELRSFCDRLPGVTVHAEPDKGGCFALSDAGYYGWRDDEGNYVLCDFGRIGPDHIPGHAHADMFSFELSLRGHRVIVDTGVYDYEVSETRRHCRSTAAHNTVEVNGEDQCEMWGAFRVARRGYPHDVRWQPGESGFSLSGWHDGYRRLGGRPVHSRRIQWDAKGTLDVIDRIRACRIAHAVSRLHLHPACSAESVDSRCIEVCYPDGRFAVVSDDPVEMTVEKGLYFPRFGARQERPVIALKAAGTTFELRYQIRHIIQPGVISHYDSTSQSFEV